MILHLCLRLPLDDATCMCVSGTTMVLGFVGYLLAAWWVGK